MFRSGPHRAIDFDYRGRHRYSVTICTHNRQRPFRSAIVVGRVKLHLDAAATRGRFAISAYCFMPDHLHLLVEGRDHDADLRRFVADFKQRSAFEYTRATRRTLWQNRYSDHVLRNEDSTETVARYIVRNPVRAGIVDDPRQYPFLGSEVYTMDELLESIRE